MKASVCPTCGAPAAPNVKQCPYCHQFLVPTTSDMPGRPPAEGRGRGAATWSRRPGKHERRRPPRPVAPAPALQGEHGV